MYIMIDSHYNKDGSYWFSVIQGYCEDRKEAEARAKVLNSLDIEGVETSVVWSEGDLCAKALEKKEFSYCGYPDDEEAKSCFEIAQAWEGEEKQALEDYLLKHGLRRYDFEGYGDLVGHADLEEDNCYIETEVSSWLEEEWKEEEEERWHEWYTSR